MAYKHPIAFTCLFLTVGVIGILPLDQAIAAKFEETPITLSCNEMALSECVRQLAETNSIRLRYPNKLKDRLLTIDASKQPLNKVVQTITSAFALDNVITHYREEDRSATILILGETEAEPAATPATGMTDSAFEALITAKVGKPLPPDLDAIALPPTNPGDKPVTVRALLENRKREELERSSPNMVILPPDENGRALTIGELRNTAIPSEDPATIVAIPPGHPDGKPITTREMKEVLDKNATMPQDLEILPSGKANAAGMTYQHVKKIQGKSNP